MSTTRTIAASFVVMMAVMMSAVLALMPVHAVAQGSPTTDPAAMAEAALAADDASDGAAESGATDGSAAAANGVAAVGSPGINLLELLAKGGGLMWPIAVMSFLVVTFGLERAIGLRRNAILCPPMVHRVQGLSEHRSGLQLDKLRQVCRDYPSAASSVVLSMMRKVGRPVSEIEHTAQEACGREAERLYANVRWLSLAAGVTPLLGLLGTVWGMIQAFFATANLPAGANKADYLAEGIYVALVTTFAGLAVAIPASVLAHMFEGRIQRMFRSIDELIEDLLPSFEEFEKPMNGSYVQADPGGVEPGHVTQSRAGQATVPHQQQAVRQQARRQQQHGAVPPPILQTRFQPDREG